MELENKLRKRRMLEALDYIDDDIISNTVKKITPDDYRVAESVMTWRTPLKHWRQYLALAACLLLLSISFPLFNYVAVFISNLTGSAGSESTEAISSELIDTDETDQHFTTESLETEQPNLSTESVYTEPVFQYVISREEFDEMTEAWKKFRNNDKAYITRTYEEFSYYYPCQGFVCVYMKKDDILVFCIHSSVTLYGEMTVAGCLFTLPQMEEIWVYKDKEFLSLTQAYNSGLLNENEIKELSEIHYEHLYSENKYG